MNTITVNGRLGKDVELKYSANGVAYAWFTIANQRNKDKVDWIKCRAWRENAEKIAEFFKKGSVIEISGSLYVDTYQSQNGETQSITYINVDKFDFNRYGFKPQSQNQQQGNAPVPQQQEVAQSENVEDDFPF